MNTAFILLILFVFVNAQYPQYVGCFTDSNEFPNKTVIPSITLNACFQICSGQNYLFAGVSGSNCYCPSIFGANGPSSNCQTACVGNPSQICGGTNSYSLYQIASGQPAEQWISQVMNFSTQYGVESWSADNVIGANNVFPSYGDIGYNWAPRESSGTMEFLELEFPIPVSIVEVQLYETYHPGALVKVSTRQTPASAWVTLWSGEQNFSVPSVARIFRPPITPSGFISNQIRLDFNCTNAPSWYELDAVKVKSTLDQCPAPCTPIANNFIPSSGCIWGGDVINIYGVFPTGSNYTCRFGASNSQASIVDYLHLQCISPPSNDSTVSITILKDGVQIPGSISFSYYTCSLSIYPVQGCMDEDNNVTIYGILPTQYSQLYCVINQAIYAPITFSGQEYTCSIPTSTRSGYVPVEIAAIIDGKFYISDSSINFYLQDCGMTVSSIDPSSGPDVGGPIITVTGTGFLNVSTLACRFWGYTVEAVYVSDTEITCSVPPGDGSVSVYVTVDGIGYSTTFATFTYNPTCPGSPICTSQGQCSSGTCICYYGYSGSTCNQVLVPLVLQPKTDSTLTEGQQYSTQVVVASGSYPVEFYLSESPDTMYINESSGMITWSSAIGSEIPWNIRVFARNLLNYDEISWKLTVQPSYTVSMTTSTPNVPVSSSATFNITSTRLSDNQRRANSPFIYWFESRGIRTEYQASTNAQGTFSFQYQPIYADVGRVTYGSKHPSKSNFTTQGTLQVIALDAYPTSLQIEAPTGTTSFSNQIVLSNPSAIALTGISVLSNSAFGASISANIPNNLASLSSVNVSLTVNAVASSTQLVVPFTLVFSSAEQAFVTITGTVIVKANAPALTLTSPISRTVLRGTSSLVDVSISNLGLTIATNLRLILPSIPFMSIATPASVMVLRPGESTKFQIQLSPTLNNSVLEPYVGNFLLRSDQQNLNIPFNIRVTSDQRGSLVVEVVDEYTYYASGFPKVGGALINLFDIQGNLTTSGFTSSNGTIKFINIPEGNYLLEIKAANHSYYKNIINVYPGSIATVITAFLSRQLVKYSWIVTPTTIDDEYIFTLDAVFETYVPFPILTVVPNVLDLEVLECTPYTRINFNVTNHGFIRADNFDMIFPINHPTLTFTKKFTFNNVPAKTSLFATVEITASSIPSTCSGNSTKRSNSIQKRSGGGCLSAYIQWSAPCGGEDKYQSAPIGFVRGRPCSGDFPFGGGYGGEAGWTNSAGTIGYASISNCDPKCQQALTKALIDCIISFVPIVGSIYSTATAINTAITKGASSQTAVAFVNAVGSIGLEFVKVSPPGIIWNSAWCIYGFVTACRTTPNGRRSIATYLMSRDFTKRSQVELAADYLRSEAGNIVAIYNLYQYPFGNDTDWLRSGNLTNPNSARQLSSWLSLFSSYARDTSDDGVKISNSERDTLTSTPNFISQSQQQKFIDRWTRTWEYWEQGWFNAADVPQPNSVDFMEFSVFTKIINNATISYSSITQQGYSNWMGAFNHAVESFKDAYYHPPEGVCARVTIRIEQRAVLSRQAFSASLEITNSSPDDLTSINVTIDIRNQYGNPANNFFAILPPTLTGITGVSGNGFLATGALGQATWTIVPSNLAAPTGPIDFLVGGSISYQTNGENITVPLYPSTITVYPNPSLSFDYFWQRDVYGDDPFTDEIEPAEPFDLGVMVSNQGFGDARKLRITSGQPYIIDNEKGLLVNFQIIDTQVGNEQVNPSLTAEIGDILSNQTKIARWRMLSSLQGTFISFNASFQHVSAIGGPEFSLVQSLSTHSLIKTIQVDHPVDDGIPDFLVDDIADPDALPDHIYCSDGSVKSPIYSVQSAMVFGTPQISINISFTPPSSSYIYLIIDDPASQDFILTSVVRSDSKNIALGVNTWRTHRIKRIQGQSPTPVDKFYIVDYQSTGRYTLHYVSQLLPPSNLVVSNSTSTSLTISWTAPPGSTRFNIQIKKANTNDTFQIVEQFAFPSQFTIAGLLPSTTYTIQIFSGSLLGDFEKVGAAVNGTTQGFIYSFDPNIKVCLSNCDLPSYGICPNASVCSHGGIINFNCSCTCPYPWGGISCDVCSISCSHGNPNIVADSCVCQCQSGWSGPNCDLLSVNGLDPVLRAIIPGNSGNATVDVKFLGSQSGRGGRLSPPTLSEISSGIAGNTSVNVPQGKFYADATFFVQLFEPNGVEVTSNSLEILINTTNNPTARSLTNKQLYVYNSNFKNWTLASSFCSTSSRGENSTYVRERVCSTGQFALFGERITTSGTITTSPVIQATTGNNNNEISGASNLHISLLLMIFVCFQLLAL